MEAPVLLGEPHSVRRLEKYGCEKLQHKVVRSIVEIEELTLDRALQELI